ncbi:MAG: TOMM precursor leader peptide-binding protein [Bacteroidota bacterium]
MTTLTVPLDTRRGRALEQGVLVSQCSSYSPDPLASALAARGWPIRDEDRGALVRVAVVDTYEHTVLQAAAAHAQAVGARWLPVKLQGAEVWVGPVLGPNASCLRGLTTRLRLHAPEAEYVRHRTGQVATAPISYTPATLHTAAQWAAAEIDGWLRGTHGAAPLEDTLLTIDIETGQATPHPVPRCAACPVCGVQPHHQPGAALLSDRSLHQPYSEITAQGDLEEAARRVRRHYSARTGLIWNRRPLPVPGAEDTFHIYAVQHPILSRVDTLQALRTNLRGQSSAIAETPEAAQTLACCEALERWSCAYQGHERHRVAAYREVAEDAIWPNTHMLYAEAQFAERNEHASDGFSFVPKPLDWDEPVAWGSAWSLTEQRPRLVLMASSFFGWKDPEGPFAAADSRGVAAGPSLAFCAWKGLLELMETDAVALWHHHRRLKPRVALRGWGDPLMPGIRRVHHGLERDLWALDLTTDLPGIHVFAAISRCRHTGHTVKGFGAHPVARHALRGAILECSQMLPNVLNESDLESETPSMPQHHLVPDLKEPVRTAASYPQEASCTLHRLVQALAKHGIEVVIQDVTRPELGVRVARVLAPGLRPWFNRFAPGRLGPRVQQSEMNRYPIDATVPSLSGPLVEDFLRVGLEHL